MRPGNRSTAPPRDTSSLWSCLGFGLGASLPSLAPLTPSSLSPFLLSWPPVCCSPSLFLFSSLAFCVFPFSSSLSDFSLLFLLTFCLSVQAHPCAVAGDVHGPISGRPLGLGWLGGGVGDGLGCVGPLPSSSEEKASPARKLLAALQGTAPDRLLGGELPWCPSCPCRLQCSHQCLLCLAGVNI